MILPDNGRIVIIDDKKEEGLPLLDTLIKEGHMATFFTQLKEGLPKKPLSGIRVIFLDLILGNEYQSSKTVLSTILNVLNRVIDKKENGPFILVAWTNKSDEAKSVEKALHSEGFRFIMTVMEKQDCKNIRGDFSVKKIRTKMHESLKENSVLQLFTLWENLIHRAAGKVVNNFSNLAESDETWNKNMELIIAKLARSVLGEHFNSKKTTEVIENAMYSLNTTLVDAIHQETHYSPTTSKIDLKIPNLPESKTKTLADGEINSRLLLKRVIDQSPVPGNIYSNNMKKVNVKKLFEGWDNFREKDDFLSKAKHIFLEVTPACDYAEKKSIVSRILPGIIWPHEYSKKFKSKTEYAVISPVLKDCDNNLFHFVFDFRMFTSIDFKKIKSKRPHFTIQNELLADIQSKLSKHVSRLGVVNV